MDTTQNSHDTSAPASNAPDRPQRAASTEISADVAAEIDAAMAELGLGPAPARGEGKADGKSRSKPGHHKHSEPRHHAANAPAGGAAPAPVRGPRVVEAGREHRAGVVVSVGPTDVFVEFGPKELGVVERTQFTDANLPKVGEQLKVVVTKYEPTESIFLCTLPGAVQKADWEMLEPGQVIEARVAGVNKGGLDLEVGGHRAFMPASQVGLDHIADLSVFVGEKLKCRVQRVDRTGRGNIVLSRRDLLAEERRAQAEQLKQTLAEGQTLEGVVRKIMPFGAFVDLGGIDGLVHLTDLTHERVGFGEKAVQKVVKEGEKVRVQILKLDWDANRISLGMKQLRDDPFTVAANQIKEGEDVTGRVIRIADFGAFVEVAPGVEGLLHVSELDYRRVAHPSNVLKEGEIITVRVLKVDPDSRRVSLSLKATKPAPEPPAGSDRGGRGRRGDRDTRTPEEILKETPALRRLREKSKAGAAGKGGIGSAGGLGIGLGDLKL